tara:strand:+ start:13343 stop:16753 length:3411 start_codon:yes stop_codon:yes gene_type:complete
MGKCVFNTTTANENIRKWLEEKCPEIVAAAKAYNDAIEDQDFQHYYEAHGTLLSQDAGERFLRDAGPARGAAWAASVRDDMPAMTDTTIPTDHLNYIENLPSAIDLSENSSYKELFDSAAALQNLKTPPKVASQNMKAMAVHARALIGQGTPGWPASSVYTTDQDVWTDADIDILDVEEFADQMESAAKKMTPITMAADKLRALQTEYAGLLDREAKDTAEELAALKEKLRKCHDAGTTKTDCMTPAELARMKELLQVKQGSLGAGDLANVAEQIAASQEPTKRTFKEQCLLLSNIVHFVEYRDDKLWPEDQKRLPYLTKTFAHTEPAVGSPPPLDINESVPTAVHANACLLASRQPWGFMNQLVQDPSFADLFEIRSHLLSQLQPMIRLYKVTSFEGDEEKETEVHFDTVYNPSVDGVLKTTKKRGFGVGIKNFVFSYEGSDPFSVKKSIKAKLSIFASSMDDLLIDRDGYRYADLALKTGSKTFSKQGSGKDCGVRSEVAPDNNDKLNFRLKVVVGWALPKSFKGATDSESDLIYKAVNNSYVTLNLTPTIHEFEINDMGHVVFHINYLAYIEEFFDDTNFNIFTDPGVAISAFKRKNIYKALKKDCGTEGKAAEKLKKLMEEDAEKIDEEKRTSLRGFLQKLLDRKKVYFKAIPFEALRAFNSQGPYWKFDLYSDVPGTDGKTQDVQVAAASDVTAETAEIVGEKPPEKQESAGGDDLSETKVSEINMKEYITFFYLSDLIDVVLENIDNTLKELSSEIGKLERPGAVTATDWKQAVAIEKQRVQRVYYNFKKFRVLLGPMELIDTKTEEYYETTVGDLPISTAYFMDWLTDKTLKRDSTVYSLPIFLKDLMNNLVRNFLNEDRCFDLNIKQRVRVFQSTITSYKSPDWGVLKDHKNIDEITEWTHQQGRHIPRLDMTNMPGASGVNAGHSNVPVLHVMGERNLPINDRGPEHTYNYMAFYAGRVQPQILMNGDVYQDSNNGIFHYVLGRDRGIIKTIKLSKTDAPGLKEVRFEQEGYDGLMQLREVYDANIVCYGAPNIVPGSYIYIDPRGFAPNTVSFGGYKDANGNPIDNTSLTRLGIGGYYMVIRAENKFGPGQCETEITAKWVAALSCEKSDAAISGPGKRRPRKCES